MNKVILMGRLTRDPDVRYSAGTGDQQQAYARYTLAVDRRVRRDNNDPNAQTADFISCVAFGRSTQFAEQYLHKGTKIAVTGRIQTGKYTNREGQTVYTTDVVVEDQEFAESKAAAERYSGGQYNGGPQGASYQDSQIPSYSAPVPAPAQAAPAPAPEMGDGGFINIPEGIDQELPFN
jgi:single-strand DNA-binding protein